MGRITIELVRKRAEHNEGEIQTLEELALHQEKLEKIENLDKWCRELKVLLLQNNNISKIENLSRMKCLSYINLALNNIEVIENLEGCESLCKLDLTLNFVGEIRSVANLRNNYFLETLYLTGNPCTDCPNYKNYVIATLPQIKFLDGNEIIKSERIKAIQMVAKLEQKVQSFEQAHKEKREMEKQIPQCGNIEDDDFWTRTTLNTPEARAQLQKRMEYDDEKKHVTTDKSCHSQKKETKVRDLFTVDGRPYNINEQKYSFTMEDKCEEGLLVFELHLPRYLDSSLIEADVQPNYLRVLIKKKIFQLCLPEEVKPDSSQAQRSRTTGHLVITMPKLDRSYVITCHTAKLQTEYKPTFNCSNNLKTLAASDEATSTKYKSEDGKIKMDLDALGSIKSTEETSCTAAAAASQNFSEDEVPPLI